MPRDRHKRSSRARSGAGKPGEEPVAGNSAGVPPKGDLRASVFRGNGLIALGSAAVLAVYSAGYVRTKPAADRMDAASSVRRPPPLTASAAPPTPGAPGTFNAADSSGAPVPSSAPGTKTTPVPVDTSTTVATVPLATAPFATAPAAIARAATAPPAAAAPAPNAMTALKAAPTTTLGAAPPAADAVTSVSVVPVVPVIPGASVAEVVAGTKAPPVTDSAPTEAPVPTAVPDSAPPAPAWRDGTFVGWGTSRHGDIEATVVIRNGRIYSAEISRCLTRYSCSWISHLLPQVVERQSADVDYVSGATQSSNALYYAVLQALQQAK
jgi:uncharacterized protein with FMN-binding domain